MPTTGHVQRDPASGRLFRDRDTHKLIRYDTGDENCCCGSNTPACCDQFGSTGPALATVVIAGATPCYACYLGTIDFNADLDDTFVLVRQAGTCVYTRDLPYTATRARWHNLWNAPLGHVASCADPIICETNRISLRLFSVAVNRFNLQVYLYTDAGAGCVGCNDASNPPVGMSRVWVFWATNIAVPFCGGTGSGSGSGTCNDAVFGPLPLCGAGGFAWQQQDETLLTGGTVGITLA